MGKVTRRAAGGVIGGLAAGVSPRRMLLRVTSIVLVLIALTIAFQNLGFAPAMRLAEIQAGSV